MRSQSNQLNRHDIMRPTDSYVYLYDGGSVEKIGTKSSQSLKKIEGFVPIFSTVPPLHELM